MAIPDGWIPMQSSMLDAVAYENGTLHALYHNGKTYSHPGVPAAKVEGLMTASSKGDYFNRIIKKDHPAQ